MATWSWKDIEDRVPKTGKEAEDARWEPLFDKALAEVHRPGSDVPVFNRLGRCTGDELCKVYISNNHIVAYYCLNYMPVAGYRDPSPLG